MFLKSSKKRILGFTLVELLVVISIIALLLAILMPSLSKARKSAQKVVCLSNMKSVGVVWNAYAGDNSDVIVPVNVEQEWFDRMPKYIFRDISLFRARWPEKPAANIFMCPANAVTYVYNYTVYATNYALNDRCGVQWSDRSVQYFPTKRTNIMRPSEKIIFSDAKVISATGVEYKYTNTWSDPAKAYIGVDYWIGRFHGKDGSNFMWADGHSSFENYSKWDARKSAGAKLWSLTIK